MTFPSELTMILSSVSVLLLGAGILTLFRMQPLIERMDERVAALRQEMEHHEKQTELRFIEMRDRILRLENTVIGHGYAGD